MKKPRNHNRPRKQTVWVAPNYESYPWWRLSNLANSMLYSAAAGQEPLQISCFIELNILAVHRKPIDMWTQRYSIKLVHLRASCKMACRLVWSHRKADKWEFCMPFAMIRQDYEMQNAVRQATKETIPHLDFSTLQTSCPWRENSSLNDHRQKMSKTPSLFRFSTVTRVERACISNEQTKYEDWETARGRWV